LKSYEVNGMKNKVLALDTNIFIYHFESNPQYIPFTSAIFTSFVKAANRGITSIISVLEVLSYPAPEKLIKEREDDFKTLPHFTVYDINHKIGLEAARLRREYKIRLPDAIQLATAIYGKADVFITNDAKIRNFNEVKVILLEEVTKT